jgi:tetratricopeptide (TPR) repeat protein
MKLRNATFCDSGFNMHPEQPITANNPLLRTSAQADLSYSAELEVARIETLLREHSFVRAVSAAAALRKLYPESRKVLYLLALGQRQLQRIGDALDTLAQMERFHPAASQLHEERGNCYVALKDAPRAIAAYECAVRVNPVMPTAWRMLERLYKLVGDETQRQRADAYARRLESFPSEVITAARLFRDSDVVSSEKLIRDFLKRRGDHVEGRRLLAQIRIARLAFDEAESLLASALTMAPNYSELRCDYARVLLSRYKYSEAIAQLDTLLRFDPTNVDYRTLRVTATVGLGDHEGAIGAYAALLADMTANSPVAADLNVSMAHSLRALGRRTEAIDAYRRAITLRRRCGDAYWGLANLKTYRFNDAEMEQLREAEAAPSLSAGDRLHVCFALGKAFEDREDYAASWHYYQRGNAMKRAASKYRPELIEQNTALQSSVCTREFFNSRAGWGISERDPIFVVGLTRSGSTLLEQILASHSMIEGASELAAIPHIALALHGANPDFSNPRYPACLAGMTKKDFAANARRYLVETRVYRHGKPLFIDKLPNNFRHVGLIHLMLPNAAIIDVRRDPMACCFSNLKQLFARGQEFCYSIDDIARYYRTYLELMSHWDQALPGRVLRVRYEDVVNDLEGSVRRVLEWCRLPFESNCLKFHLTERSVRTPSAEQVRQPIFREGLNQWRHYEPWLGPLREALGDAIDRCRID